MRPGCPAVNGPRASSGQSFVSLLSDQKVPVDVISRLVGHRSSSVTETVYRKQLRPVIEGSADVMDRLFPLEPKSEG